MTMRSFGLALAVTALSCSAAIAAPTQELLNGTIASVSAGKVVLHTRGGHDISVLLNGDTAYLEVAKSSLDHVEKGSYIGTATSSIGTKLVALEVAIFPPSMRGTGEGHYAWGMLPDTALSGGGMTDSTMTNGNVTAVSAPTEMVNSTMTNGNVSMASSQGDVKQLTVTYKGGQQVVIVPPTAPIVAFRPGVMSDVTKGAPVFIKAAKDDGKVVAKLVAVGIDGVTPPM